MFSLNFTIFTLFINFFSFSLFHAYNNPRYKKFLQKNTYNFLSLLGSPISKNIRRTKLKTINETKKLQQTEPYKELKENLQSYYHVSIEKENKQKSYLSGISLINKTNGEIFKMDYEFEKEHTKYNKVIEQKINTIEQIAKSLGFTRSL